MSKEFYVIVNKKNLMFCKDEDDYTMDVEKAMQFDTYTDCRCELETFDDDVVYNFAIYKVEKTVDFKFERM